MKTLLLVASLISIGLAKITKLPESEPTHGKIYVELSTVDFCSLLPYGSDDRVGEYLKRWGFTPQKPLSSANRPSSKVAGLWVSLPSCTHA